METTEQEEMNPVIDIEQCLKDLFQLPKTQLHNTNGLITNPNAVKPLLEYLLIDNRGDERNNQGVIIGLVGRCGNNSLVLNAMAKTYSKNPKTDSVFLTINALFSNSHPDKANNQEQSICDNLLILLRRLVNGHRFKKKHLEWIYSKIKQKEPQEEEKAKQAETETSKVSPSSTYSFEKISIAIEIISTVLANDMMFNGPQNFIYFNGYNMPNVEKDIPSGITTFKKGISGKSPFKSSFTVSVWFRMEELEYSEQSYVQHLFTFFKSEMAGFECFLVRNQMYYRVIKNHYTPPEKDEKAVFLGEFDPEEWYYLAIVHEKKFLGGSTIKAIVNGKQVMSAHLDFPKMDRATTLDKATIANKFCGQISTFILFRESISSDKLKKIYTFYPYGLYKKEHANMLNESAIFDEKLIKRIEFLYTPVRSTPNVGVWDLVNQYFGSLEANCGVWVEEDFKDQFSFCGGLEGILPILNLIRNRVTCIKEGKILLQRYLELVCQSINAVAEHYDSKIRFIKAFFLLLENIPRDFFQIKTIQLLAEIRFSLPSECRHQYFLSLLHSADIWINCSTSIQKEFWAFVNDIYLQDPEYYHNIFSIPELVDFSLKLSEIKEGMVHTTQRLSPKFKRPDSKEEGAMKDLSLILGVVEKLFIKGGSFISENIKYLTPALTSKASATFKYEILKLLKVLLVDTEEDSVCPPPIVFAEHFIENCGMHILLYLCINSPLDVISMCLKLIDVISSLKKSKKLNIDTDIIPFLSNIILAKIKDRPVITSPSGKDPQLLPSIEEELEANMTGEKKHSLKRRRTNSNDDLVFENSEPVEKVTFNRMSTQNFTRTNFGLELDVEEANKGFDNKNRNVVEDPFDDAQKRESIAAKFRQEMMIEDNILNQAKEVPPGPKSKSVPRNAGFFGMSKSEEEAKKPPPQKNKTRSFFDPFREESKEDNEEIDTDSPAIMIESGAPLSKDNMKGVIKKRFAFLNTNEEEKKEPEGAKLVMNPAATGATELQSDSSSERSEVLNFSKGKNLFKKPMINTEAINEMFNYGGEKGDLLIRVQDEEEKNEIFLKELDSIASICVAAMNRNSPDDEIEGKDISSQEGDETLSLPSYKAANFNAPRTMRGLTQIEFSKAKDDDIKPLKSYLHNDPNVIQEEPSSLPTSKSSSSRPEFNTPTSLLAPDPQKGLREKAAVEEFNQGIEALYVSILEWMLNRSPSNLNEPLMIDDSDEINNSNVLIICFNLIKHSNDLLKQKSLQDFQMLAKLNKINCSHMIENKFYHSWILELLLPYQQSASQERLSGPSLAVYDIGTKLYTIVLLHSLINEPRNRFIPYLARWPLILRSKVDTGKPMGES